MDGLWSFLSSRAVEFSTFEITVLVLNLFLLVLARPLFRVLSHGKLDSGTVQSRLHIYRVINVLIILLLLFYKLYLPIAGQSWITKIIGALLVIYFSYLGYHVLGYFIDLRFGKRRVVEDRRVVSVSYNSRALNLLSAILISIAALISVIQIFDFESLLEAGGVIGFLGILLALTQAAWAPDIISGLIILNSRLMEEGDVIEVEAEKGDIIGVVFKPRCSTPRSST